MGRMDQNSSTEMFVPKVTCIDASCPAYELLFSLWWGSRHKNSYTPQELSDARIYPYTLLGTYEGAPRSDIQEIRDEICEAYPEYSGESHRDLDAVYDKIVRTLIDSDLPPLEAVHFTFEIDNCTVAFREQLVRGRYAGYWTQTSRTMDLQYMDVNINKSVSLLGGEKAVKIYEDTVSTIREAYKMLQELGVPSEDIRLQPSAQVHRVYWMVNLRVLLKTLKKRVDWIAQSSLWSPVISGILQEMDRVVTPELVKIIREVVGRPAVTLSQKSLLNQYTTVSAHHYDIENMDRYTQKDPQPVDPLWLAYRGVTMPEHTDLDFYDLLKSMYINTWSDEYLEVLHWNKEDPKAIGPYDRPLSWFKENDLLYMVEGLNETL